MGRQFEITAVNEQAAVKAGEEAKFTFTVSNMTGAPMKATLSVLTEDPEAGKWLKISGERERVFPPGSSTEQVTVTATPPKKAKGGPVKLRLVVAPIEVPDDGTTSPEVTLDVSAPDGPQPKPFPWWILAVVGGVIVIGVVLAIVLSIPKKPGFKDICEAKTGCQENLACSAGDICRRIDGQNCSDGDDCASGNCGDKKCVAEPPVPKLGEPCPNEICAEGFGCVTGLCRAPDGFKPCVRNDQCMTLNCRTDGTCGLPMLGDACTPDKLCAENLGCKANKCLGELGFSCSKPVECLTGFCENNVCAQRGLLDQCSGSNCDAAFTCVNGLCRGKDGFAGCSKNEQCAIGFCRSDKTCGKPGLEESCAVVASCESPLSCDTDKRCRKANGAACAADSECKDGHCRNKKCDAGIVGELCSDTMPCKSGNGSCEAYNVPGVTAKAVPTVSSHLAASSQVAKIGELVRLYNPLAVKLCLLATGASCTNDFYCESMSCSSKKCVTAMPPFIPTAPFNGCSYVSSTDAQTDWNTCVNPMPTAMQKLFGARPASVFK